MGMIAVCDNCGKREPAEEGIDHRWYKPREWRHRVYKNGIQIACCRECAVKIKEREQCKTT